VIDTRQIALVAFAIVTKIENYHIVVAEGMVDQVGVLSLMLTKRIGGRRSLIERRIIGRVVLQILSCPLVVEIELTTAKGISNSIEETWIGASLIDVTLIDPIVRVAKIL
jgi:hypothetical protein